jgi:hypothetical protein
MAIGNASPDSGFAIQHAFKNQLADSGANGSPAYSKLCRERSLVGQQCALLVFGCQDHFTQQLFHLRAQRDRAVVVERKHVQLYKQILSVRQNFVFAK